LSTQPNNLAIGPDGRAYATDGASQIQAVTPAGAQATLIIPAPGGNVGFLKGIFDGHNGYLYAPYDDGLHAGREYFYRISY
jgi:sugar lactone lactonase YvrE